MEKNIAPVDIRRKLWLTLFKSLIVPVLVLVFFTAAPHWLNGRLRSSSIDAINNSSRLSPAERDERIEKIEKLDFRQVCENCPPGMERLHERLITSGIAATFERLHYGLILSQILVGGLIASVVAIFLLNIKARKSQDDLIRSFQLGWKICMAAALAKVFLLIPLLAYGTFEFTVLLSDHYYPKLLLIIIVGGLIALWRSGSILLKKVPLEFAEAMSREVTPEEAPELWQVVRRAAERLKTSPPDRILIGLQFNFYVTELAVRHDGGRTEGKTLYFSFPLLKQLSEEEVVAIIGHELGHFIGEDTKLTRKFYPLRLKANATVMALASSGWIGWPSVQLLSYFTWCFSETERLASRARELLADQKAAELTSPQIAAQALLRFQVACEAFQRGLKEAVKDKALDPLNMQLQTIVQEKLAPEETFWTQLFEKRLPHPLDTHPPLHVRLEALGQSTGVEQAKAIALTPIVSAFENWFSHRQVLFAALSKQAATAVEKMRSHSAVAAADYQTDAGKQLLDQHFPEKKWAAKPSAILGVLAIILGIFFGGMAMAINDLTARIIFGALLAFAIALGVLYLRQRQRKVEITLNADGISHTNWVRPLRFQDVKNITGQKQYSTIILTFHLKNKQPSIRKGGLFRFPAKRVTLALGTGLQVKPLTVANAIIKYFARQTEN